eukprot:Amastigsp_a1235_25.p4 type:complete len:119 gc:universal Amastigsp_a1235_25:384-740(+)
MLGALHLMDPEVVPMVLVQLGVARAALAQLRPDARHLDDPRVENRVLQLDALLRVYREELANVGARLGRDRVPVRRRELELAAFDHLEQLGKVLRVERREPAQQRVEDDTARPHVCLE